MIVRDTIKLGNSSYHLHDAAMTVVTTRTFREENNTNAKNEDPEEGDAQRYSPRGSACFLFHAEVGTVCNENSECGE
jgi:hypothetical protein